ncbi:hypothetical protein SNEBB_002199, partial [Seison nebaliae]
MSKKCDFVFLLDCTSSMCGSIRTAKQKIRDIVEDIVHDEDCELNVALISFRDHPPQDRSYITKVFDFTDDIEKMKKNVGSCSASGGGDGPEASTAAMGDCLNLSWRDDAIKIAVLITDAPPHGVEGNCGDGFPKGDPSGLDPVQLATEFAAKSISLYVAHTVAAIGSKESMFYQAISYITGGQFVPLHDARLLAELIIGGMKEEIDINDHLEEVEKEVL